MQFLVPLLFIISAIAAVPFGTTKTKCGYKACHPVDPDALNIHLIPHSHDDVGWLKTVDQYYYGSRNSIQLAGVQYIIDSVVEALLENPDRRFIQVETAFLSKWWLEQTADMRENYIRLINNGQIEIVGGAWSMNDEAATHYQSLIDQFTLGLKFLTKTFGECARPKIGWQIDPFGHSREMASIFAHLGYDAFFVVRIDYRDKAERLRTKTAELIWEGSPNIGNDSRIFTHILYDHYKAPSGFNFDILTSDDPIVANKNSLEYNLDKKIASFKQHVINQSRNYTTNNVLIAMGDDFTYQDAHYNFANIDSLIRAFDDSEQYDPQGRRIKLMYSTPGCYAHAVNEYAKKHEIKFPLKTDDFMPLASDAHSYWSGYYTSRPTQKRFERMGNNLLQSAQQLGTMLQRTSVPYTLQLLEMVMGVMQHHDAITGTEKTHVAQDYAMMWNEAMLKPEQDISNSITEFLRKSYEVPYLEFKSCLLTNVSFCEVSLDKQQFVVSVYNPLSRPVSYNVRLPVNDNKFEVKGLDDSIVEYQLLPSIESFSYVEDLNPGKFDLVFTATDVPALGMKMYYIENQGSSGKDPTEVVPPPRSIGTKDLNVSLNKKGLITDATFGDKTLMLGQKLMYYEGAVSNDNAKKRSSGAYAFRPAEDSPVAKDFDEYSYKVYTGSVVDEIHQTFSKWAKQIVRIYKNHENHIEFEWLVGPIDISDNIGKEVISRFSTGINSGKYFKTDSNGRELITRARNERSTFVLTQEEPIAQNYYPVTSFIAIEDENLQFSVITDRSQGGSSLNWGQIELMVHRSTLKDDGFGLGEALNETEFGKGVVVRGQHFVTFGSAVVDDPNYSRKQQREIAERKLLSPWVFIADASKETLNFEALKKTLNFQVSGLTRPYLHEYVRILTLKYWEAGKILLRLEHTLEKLEGGTDATVNLEGLFMHFNIVSMVETTLGGNQPLNEKERFEWVYDRCLNGLEECPIQRKPNHDQQRGVDTKSIILTPMQIRTFIAEIEFIDRVRYRN